MRISPSDRKQLSLFPTPYSEVDKTVLRNGIRFYTEHVANIPAPIVCKYFQEYKLLYWSAEYLIEKIYSGCIENNTVAYKVVYAKGVTRGKILQDAKRNQSIQYKISIRWPDTMWNLDPVIMISFGATNHD